MIITYEDIRNNDHINIYIKKADDTLKAMGNKTVTTNLDKPIQMCIEV